MGRDGMGLLSLNKLPIRVTAESGADNKSFYRKFLLHLPDGGNREVRFVIIAKKLED